MTRRAVAIDFGASSARFAIGELGKEGSIRFEVVEQIPHKPIGWNGHEVWDIDLLHAFCRRALDAARKSGAESLAIDTWGVDHGFLDSTGKLLQPPICYRDKSHVEAFESLADHRGWLYEQTGIQHQPFNTLYQLVARRNESPSLFEDGTYWLLLPDLMIFMLGAEPGFERSIASTTQLTGTDGDWNMQVFSRFQLPPPRLPIIGAGTAGIVDGVSLRRVNGHDTASAVLGMGSLQDSAFASIGTWALVGKLGRFDSSSESAGSNWTNERQTDGTVRRLTNVPGFYVLNRLHEELGVRKPFGEWLESSPSSKLALDLYDPRLFAPDSMPDAMFECLGAPAATEELAGIAIGSLVAAISDRVSKLDVSRVRIAGGGSQSQRLCQGIANRTHLPVIAGPVEATIVGNLALQFADGNTAIATAIVDASLETSEFLPEP